MAKEQWKNLKQFGGGIQVSSKGRVRRVIYLNGILSKQGANVGYLRISAHRNDMNGSRMWPVHRLVAEAFIGPIKNGSQVNHKNGVKIDNRLENLEIVTASENQIHSHRVLGNRSPVGSKHGRSQLTEEQVLEIRRLGANREWGVGAKLSKQFGIGQQMISFILNRKNWKHI